MSGFIWVMLSGYIGLNTSVANDFMFAVLADGALSHSSFPLTMDKMAILMDKMVLGGSTLDFAIAATQIRAVT